MGNDCFFLVDGETLVCVDGGDTRPWLEGNE